MSFKFPDFKISAPFPCKDYGNDCECQMCCSYDPGRKGATDRRRRQEEQERINSRLSTGQVRKSYVAGRHITAGIHHTAVGLIFEDGRRLFIEFDCVAEGLLGLTPIDARVRLFHHDSSSPEWYGEGDWKGWGNTFEVTNKSLKYDEIVLRVMEEGRKRRYLLAATDPDAVNTNCRTFAIWILQYVGARPEQIDAVRIP
jgi:hypothetical protein